jgi:peptidoglycan hydrolase CwlO-like protein
MNRDEQKAFDEMRYNLDYVESYIDKSILEIESRDERIESLETTISELKDEIKSLERGK